MKVVCCLKSIPPPQKKKVIIWKFNFWSSDECILRGRLPVRGRTENIEKTQGRKEESNQDEPFTRGRTGGKDQDESSIRGQEEDENTGRGQDADKTRTRGRNLQNKR